MEEGNRIQDLNTNDNNNADILASYTKNLPDVGLPKQEKAPLMYVVAKPGTGKSTFARTNRRFADIDDVIMNVLKLGNPGPTEPRTQEWAKEALKWARDHDKILLSWSVINNDPNYIFVRVPEDWFDKVTLASLPNGLSQKQWYNEALVSEAPSAKAVVDGWNGVRTYFGLSTTVNERNLKKRVPRKLDPTASSNIEQTKDLCNRYQITIDTLVNSQVFKSFPKDIQDRWMGKVTPEEEKETPKKIEESVEDLWSRIIKHVSDGGKLFVNAPPDLISDKFMSTGVIRSVAYRGEGTLDGSKLEDAPIHIGYLQKSHQIEDLKKKHGFLVVGVRMTRNYVKSKVNGDDKSPKYFLAQNDLRSTSNKIKKGVISGEISIPCEGWNRLLSVVERKLKSTGRSTRGRRDNLSPARKGKSVVDARSPSPVSNDKESKPSGIGEKSEEPKVSGERAMPKKQDEEKRDTVRKDSPTLRRYDN